MWSPTSRSTLQRPRLCSFQPGKCPVLTTLTARVSCTLTTNHGKDLERLSILKLLGTHIHHHLQWTNHVNKTISSCYSTLAILRKLKNLAPFSMKKQFAECPILSKLYYNDTVFNPPPVYLTKTLQRVQLAVAGFVLKRYACEKDIIPLGWLPIPERRDYNQWRN